MSENTKERDEAFRQLRKIAQAEVAPHTEALIKKAIHNMGGDTKTMAKALALGKILRDGKVGGSFKIGDVKVNGKIDAKNKAIKAGVSWDF